MPNWITNKVKAPSHVISALINNEGEIDFTKILPFDGEWPWDSVIGDAETMAEVVTKKTLSDHPLIAKLELSNHQSADLKKLSDESFDQFIQMLRNFRKCGYLHGMDFARAVWGTKWNACDQSHNIEGGECQFETAWACPRPVLESLSKKFPDDAIEVRFADEDIGCNCGSFTLRGGEYIASDIAPAYQDQSDEQKVKWKAFAYETKGWEPESDDED